MNIIIGIRGGGKTYGAKALSIRQFLKQSKKTAWVRRTKAELEGDGKSLSCMSMFFDDIRGEFPHTSFKTKKFVGYINKQPAIYFVPLSTSLTKYKSTPMPDVDTIIFDEFLIVDGASSHYLKNEVKIFMEFVESVARLRDNVRVIMIANAVTFANPYFITWNITPDKFRNNFYIDRKNGLIVELYDNKNFRTYKEKTKLGKFLNLMPDYKEYALQNTFLQDNYSFIKPKPKQARYFVGLRVGGHSYPVWLYQGQFYVTKKGYDPCQKTYALTSDDHAKNTFLLLNKRSRLDYLMHAYENGSLFFENVQIQDQILKGLNLFVQGV